MQNWSDGYVTEIEYDSSYFGELAPARLDYVCVQMGRRPPAAGRPFDYCELGCGRGLTTSLLAAANPGGRFWGVDFNPSHIAGARALAEAAGLDNVTFLDTSFEELADSGLPEFDYVTLHGVWSWVSAESRASILRFLHSRVRPGGVVYISYNCLVGWDCMVAASRLFRELVDAGRGPLAQRIGQAIEVLEALAAGGEGYFHDNPSAVRWVHGLRGHSPAYLAHEYLNDHWTQFLHRDVVDTMAGAKLEYIGSADAVRNFDGYALRAPTATMAQHYGDRVLTETLKDFDTRWSLRRDIYARGTASWSPVQAAAALGRTSFALVESREQVSERAEMPGAQAMIQPALLDPLVEALSERPHTLDELLGIAQPAGFELADVLVLCTILCQASVAAPLPVTSGREGESRAMALNRVIADRTFAGESIPFLASAVTGAALHSADLERCCYRYLAADPDLQPEALVASIMTDLTGAEEVPTIEGQEATAQDYLEAARSVVDQKLPLWRSLGVI